MTYQVVERPAGSITAQVYAYQGWWFWVVLVRGEGFRKGWEMSAVAASNEASKAVRHVKRTGKLP